MARVLTGRTRMIGKAPLVVDLFSGAGGMALGFHAAGCLIRLAVDIDEVAGESFRKNFSLLQRGHEPEVRSGKRGDLKRLKLEEIPAGRQADIVIGGPPCQAFSRIGRGKLDSLSDEGFVGDPRNRLYERFLEAVDLWKPRAVVMENVPGMLSVAGVNYARVVSEELAGIGYRTGYALLNAVFFGVPQFRERLFFIGIRDDLGTSPTAPKTTHFVDLPDGYRRPVRERTGTLPFVDELHRIEGELSLGRARTEEPAITVSQAIDDLPVLSEHLDGSPLPRGNFRRDQPYRSEPHSAYARLMREWTGFPPSLSVDEHATRRTPRDYGLFRRMSHGERYPDALRHAESEEQGLFERELGRLRSLGEVIEESSDRWESIRSRFIPPYDPEKFLDKWRKLYPDKPSWTVPAHLGKDSYSHIHHDSEQARMISPREAARLQSFPDAFKFEGNMGECFRQIGNAVPPLLARAIAREVLARIGVTS